MRLFNYLVFDEFVYGTASVYTDPKWNPVLGAAEKSVIHAVVDQLSGSGSLTLTVKIEHTADNLPQNFTAKNASAEISAVTISTGQTNSAIGTDPTSASNYGIPTAGFARLNIALGGTTPQAHIRIWVTGRAEQARPDLGLPASKLDGACGCGPSKPTGMPTSPGNYPNGSVMPSSPAYARSSTLPASPALARMSTLAASPVLAHPSSGSPSNNGGAPTLAGPFNPGSLSSKPMKGQ